MSVNSDKLKKVVLRIDLLYAIINKSTVALLFSCVHHLLQFRQLGVVGERDRSERAKPGAVVVPVHQHQFVVEELDFAVSVSGHYHAKYNRIIRLH